jgi:ribA/ribD-fused uncharacterized protein
MQIMSAADHNEKFYEDANGVYFKSGPYSQWFLDAPFIDTEGIEYNCNEQYMMAKKAQHFKDYETYNLIMAEKQPKEQKKLGRSVKNFDEDEWNTVADRIVYDANLMKFSQHPELELMLVKTNDKLIVEASPYDKIWGIGLNITDALNTPIDQYPGTNRLGKAIMRVRETLQSCYH